MNGENVEFSSSLREQRMKQAQKLLGNTVVNKLVCYALFVCGVTRKAVASFLDMPEGSVRSLVRAVNKDGLPALEDRRSKNAAFRPPPPINVTPMIEEHQDNVRVNFGVGDLVIDIPKDNEQQKKTVLLTLLNNNLLKSDQVAKAIHLSEDRTRKLATSLKGEDVQGIIDHRRGQHADYTVTPAVKAELIQQYVLDIVAHGKTSGKMLARSLDERCGLRVSPRSILRHIAILGLSQIKTSLPMHLEELKKKSGASSIEHTTRKK
jgi:hypothetical protein